MTLSQITTLRSLQRMWNVGPSNLDTAVLSCLSNKPLRAQEHILLSFAAIDLTRKLPRMLSARVQCEEPLGVFELFGQRA